MKMTAVIVGCVISWSVFASEYDYVCRVSSHSRTSTEVRVLEEVSVFAAQNVPGVIYARDGVLFILSITGHGPTVTGYTMFYLNDKNEPYDTGNYHVSGFGSYVSSALSSSGSMIEASCLAADKAPHKDLQDK